jgi:hypothetical protein
VLYTDDEKIAAFDHVLALFHEVYQHCEYCGWGDSWERSCVTGPGGLIGRASDAIDAFPTEVIPK